MSKSAFAIGQLVTLSNIGRQSLSPTTAPALTGKVIKAKAKYPDAIAVIMDGNTTPRYYHKSYWQAMN